jgi:1-acyl-sn-glycerol-3-phosphate acyltransferase
MLYCRVMISKATNLPKSAPKPTFSQRLAHAILKMFGWEATGVFPDLPKFVLVGAPHTTNWDFPLAMLLMFAGGVRFNWIGKDSLFRWPMEGFFRRLGGIPVKRERNSNFVGQIVDAFNHSSHLIIAIAPEGTRSLAKRWKTGFYYMALGAQVPLVLGFVDYRRRQVGVGPVIHPSEDIEATFAELRAFYADKTGKYPHKKGEITLDR